MNVTPQFERAADMKGYLKVRLFYHTWEPHHVRSQVLQTELRMEPPFVEDISVLISAELVRNHISAFESIFHQLQILGRLKHTDKLKSFEIRDEDVRTLAYYQVNDQKEAA